jgi:Spy/CpxP family protein refolding chaperone
MAQDNTNTDRQNRRNRDGGQGGPGGPGGFGNMDPAQRQQFMMDRTKETLEITDDKEWKALEPLVTKVMDARRETLAGLGRGFGRGGRGGPGGDNNAPRGGFGGTPSPEAEALQKTIDAKAPNAEIKAALAKYVESRKVKQAALEKAQADLRKVLTPRQEALAALNGLL